MNKLDPKDEDYAKKLDNMFYQDADTFFPSSIPDALTFDDISLKTCYSEILPSKTNPTIKLSKNIELATPIISADMDTVTESDTAIAMALNGGLGVIHCNMSPEQQIEEVSRVKNHGHGVIENPVTMSQDQTIGDVLKKIEEEKYDFSTFPIVDEYGKLV
jgi:IMP dehydrogenase